MPTLADTQMPWTEEDEEKDLLEFFKDDPDPEVQAALARRRSPSPALAGAGMPGAAPYVPRKLTRAQDAAERGSEYAGAPTLPRMLPSSELTPGPGRSSVSSGFGTVPQFDAAGGVNRVHAGNAGVVGRAADARRDDPNREKAAMDYELWLVGASLDEIAAAERITKEQAAERKMRATVNKQQQRDLDNGPAERKTAQTEQQLQAVQRGILGAEQDITQRAAGRELLGQVHDATAFQRAAGEATAPGGMPGTPAPQGEVGSDPQLTALNQAMLTAQDEHRRIVDALSQSGENPANDPTAQQAKARMEQAAAAFTGAMAAKRAGQQATPEALGFSPLPAGASAQTSPIGSPMPDYYTVNRPPAGLPQPPSGFKPTQTPIQSTAFPAEAQPSDTPLTTRQPPPVGITPRPQGDELTELKRPLGPDGKAQYGTQFQHTTLRGGKMGWESYPEKGEGGGLEKRNKEIADETARKAALVAQKQGDPLDRAAKKLETKMERVTAMPAGARQRGEVGKLARDVSGFSAQIQAELRKAKTPDEVDAVMEKYVSPNAHILGEQSNRLQTIADKRSARLNAEGWKPIQGALAEWQETENRNRTDYQRTIDRGARDLMSAAGDYLKRGLITPMIREYRMRQQQAPPGLQAAYADARDTDPKERTAEQKKVLAQADAKYGLVTKPLTREEASAIATETAGPMARARVSEGVTVTMARGLERAGLPEDVARRLSTAASDPELPSDQRRALWRAVGKIIETRQYNLADIEKLLPQEPAPPTPEAIAQAGQTVTDTIGQAQAAMPSVLGGAGQAAGAAPATEGPMVTLKDGTSVPQSRIDAARAKAATSSKHAEWLAKYVD